MKQTHKSQKSQNRALDVDDIDYQCSGVPAPLPDTPRITKMTDNSLTLIWLPSVPEQPRFPVSYVVEFGKIKDGVWIVYQSGNRLLIKLIINFEFIIIVIIWHQTSKIPNVKSPILNLLKIIASESELKINLESAIRHLQSPHLDLNLKPTMNRKNSSPLIMKFLIFQEKKSVCFLNIFLINNYY